MWLMLNKGFLSVVSKDCKPSELLVRARVKQHILNYFPEAKVTRTPGNDYLYRATIRRSDIAEVLAFEIGDVEYSNFKGSVRDQKLHDAYMNVWHAMARVQETPPYKGHRASDADSEGGTED